MLKSLRYLVAHGLAQAGYDSTVIGPILNIFTQLEVELDVSGFEFTPELELEFSKLDQALLLLNEETIHQHNDEAEEDFDPFDDELEDELEDDEDDWDDFKDPEDDDEDE